MKAAQQLHDLGQSLWLGNITRELLTGGTLARYINGDNLPLDEGSAEAVEALIAEFTREGVNDEALTQKTHPGADWP